jgi:hypothetical protein
MVRRKPSPREIIERLEMAEAMIEDGTLPADAIRSAGMSEAELERLRIEYAGLLRTLGALGRLPAKPAKRVRRSVRARAARSSE